MKIIRINQSDSGATCMAITYVADGLARKYGSADPWVWAYHHAGVGFRIEVKIPSNEGDQPHIPRWTTRLFNDAVIYCERDDVWFSADEIAFGGYQYDPTTLERYAIFNLWLRSGEKPIDLLDEITRPNGEMKRLGTKVTGSQDLSHSCWNVMAAEFVRRFKGTI